MSGREYSKDKIIDLVLEEIDDQIISNSNEDSENDFNENGKLKGKSVVDTVLFLLEGENPGLPEFNLISEADGAENINRTMMQVIYELDDEELINSYIEQEKITPVTKEFAIRVRDLIEKYDNDEITFSNELVAQILELIDNGIDGKKFSLMAYGNEEDILDAQENDYEYFPSSPINIAGDLANRYREKYLPKVHECTSDEMGDMLLDEIHTQLENWNRMGSNRNANGMIQGDFAVHLILSVLDGEHMGLPYVDFVTKQDGERINGELHSIINNSDEKLRGFVEEGTIPKAKADFLIEVKDLVKKYDDGQLGTCDDLAYRILDMVDNGFTGHKCVLKAGTEPEERIDYDEQFDDDITVFPIDYPVVSGDLAKRYQEKYMNKVQNRTEKTNNINAHSALNVSLGGEDKVISKDLKGVRAFLNGIGKIFDGGTKDDR